MSGIPTPDEASAALNDAEASRQRLAGELVLPSFFNTSIGAAIAVQIATTSAGLVEHGVRSVGLVVAGVVVFGLVAAVQLARFRRANGVWLGGLASKVVLGTATTASLAYGMGAGVAIWAAFAGAWWLVALGSMAGGAAYAASGWHWVRLYRDDPAAHGRGESARWWGMVGAVALVALVPLVVLR